MQQVSAVRTACPPPDQSTHNCAATSTKALLHRLDVTVGSSSGDVSTEVVVTGGGGRGGECVCVCLPLPPLDGWIAGGRRRRQQQGHIAHNVWQWSPSLLTRTSGGTAAARVVAVVVQQRWQQRTQRSRASHHLSRSDMSPLSLAVGNERAGGATLCWQSS